MNLADFMLTQDEVASRSATQADKPPRHRPGERFMRGPIPWSWLERAAILPGKALQVSLVIWQIAGCSRRRTVKLSLVRVGLGVNEQAARRAIYRLEQAGLISVVRKPGHALEVVLLDVPPIALTSQHK
jgi:hypothetical protein